MFLLIGALASLLAQAPPPGASIEVDASRVLNRVTPWMYGSCIEDVNHEIYGGLYAQMIFGESFEEPPASVAPIDGWTVHGGRWTTSGGATHVEADMGAKLVRTEPVTADGVIDCDVRLDDDRGDNAGLIVRVSDPRTGADAWIGYEISISYKNHAVILGRHRNDWTLLKSAPADVRVGTWHRLRVQIRGTTIRVWLDPVGAAGAPLIEYDDGRAAPTGGRVGVRTWQSRASFRNLSVQAGGSRTFDGMDRPAAGSRRDEVSGMWTGYSTGAAAAGFEWQSDRPYNSERSQRIVHRGGSGEVGVFNLGLNRWGLSVRAGGRCTGHLYVRQPSRSPGLVVALQSADGRRTYATARLAPARSDWTRRDFTLTSTATDPNARLSIALESSGEANIDQVVLMPPSRDLFHGLPVRADIADALLKGGITFLRYGGSMVNAPGYRWKQMIGDRDRRPQYAGTWYPYSTNGFGVEEFVQFCRAARIEPAFAINIEETPEDAADLVEYLNGPATSPWGAKRAANGHAAPYGVRTIEIGNEETTNGHYIDRFKLLEPAMHRMDPKLQLVIAAWWEPNNPISRRIVEELNGKAALWDVHVGGDELAEGANVDALFTRMEQLVREWAPGTPLKACIFEENGGRHDLQRALGHARVLNATQRHGDFVLMDCPANCLQALGQNDNGWDQGQLFYTPDKVWGMPPFYSQQMAARNHLPLRVAGEVRGASQLDVTATRSEDGRTLVLKLVNVAALPIHATIRLRGFAPLGPSAQTWTLAGALTTINVPGSPRNAAPIAGSVPVNRDGAEMELAAYSYTVVKFRRR